MDAHVFLRDARSHAGHPAVVCAPVPGRQRLQTAGILLSVSLRRAFYHASGFGEDLPAKKMLPRAPCRFPPRLLPVLVHLPADFNRECGDQHGEHQSGFCHAARCALPPRFVLHKCLS